MSKLQSVVRLYVPSRQGQVEIDKVRRAAILDKVTGDFSRWFGGATESEAKGAWYSDNDGVVRESITIVSSYTTPLELEAKSNWVFSLASEVKRELGQEAVAVELDGLNLI